MFRASVLLHRGDERWAAAENEAFQVLRDLIVEAIALHRAGVTEWKHAQSFFAELERQNQLILNAAGEGIYGVNAEGKTTFLNRAAQ